MVQDLAGTSFALSGLARDVGASHEAGAGSERLSRELERLASAVRASLLSLRSLLVEIYPPQLDGAGLGAALQDLVAPAQQADIDVSLRVDGAESMSDQATALVWRTAQECVRNAVRHGQPSRLDVSVTVSEASTARAARGKIEKSSARSQRPGCVTRSPPARLPPDQPLY